MIEVFFRENLDTEPDTDIVFSIEEAEEAVLDFYNEQIEIYCPQCGLLENYNSIAAFKKSECRIPGDAWFRHPQNVPSEKTTKEDIQALEEVSDEVICIDYSNANVNELDPDKFINDFTDVMMEKLENLGMSVSAGKIKNIVTDGLWQVLSKDIAGFEALANQSAEDDSEMVAISKDLEHTDVLLVIVDDEDIAVYMDDEYIDSADQSNEEDVQVIVDTANLLADKYGTEVKTHYFKEMREGWSWTRVELILKTLGILPHGRNNLYQSLQLAGLVKMNSMAVSRFELDEEAIEHYSARGDGSWELIRLFFEDESGGENMVSLTMDEVANASEVKENVWICDDVSGTELTVLLFKALAVDTTSLLR